MNSRVEMNESVEDTCKLDGDGGMQISNNCTSEVSSHLKRKCGSDSNIDEEDSELPSSSHMSNSKFDQLDCENDVGDDSSIQGESSVSRQGDGDEPPRKKLRDLISIESKRNMIDQDKFDLEIIDDIEGDDDEDDSKGEDSDGEYVDDNEIYAWLEEGINKESIGADGNDKEPILREKIVLKELCHDPFNIIPEGWVVVTHNCGMPVYLHKDSRVVTLSQPYFLGPGSVRKHNIPLSAIPCLHYRRCLDKTEDQNKENPPSNCVNENFSPNCTSTTEGQESVPVCPRRSGEKESPTPHDGTKSGSKVEVIAECDSSQLVQKAGDPQQTDSVPSSTVSHNDQDIAGDTREDSDTADVVKRSKPQDAESSDHDGPEQNVNTVITNGIVSKNESSRASTTNVDECVETPNDNCLDRKGVYGSSVNIPAVKVESAGQRLKESSLDAQEVRKYCEKLFQFKIITVRKYKTWRERRRHFLQIKKQSRPELPMNTKLITCPLPNSNKPGEKGGKRKDFVLNPSGKSHVCILHEYVQHTMRVQPRYVFKELENAATPYSARVIIEDVEYGIGYASSKKAAKLEAAKNTLKILIPEMNKVDNEDHKTLDDDFSFFDNIKIEDPRVFELGTKAGHQSPNQILCECLRRNYGLGDTHCEMTMRKIKNQKSEFTMTVGKHTATVIAKNKRDGKQQAAQAILQKLHSHVTSWGSILRLYGKGSQKGFAEKKDELNISELQSQAKANRSSNPILEKLKEEMHKLHECKVAMKSKGKLRIESTELPLKVPSLDL
ncbi:microprocessor complex subunit DGCR8-like [Gigantopelta aegis]|uniref:microprocessor complex subunit DGCR8-like n=1 Tax=Gigantopelta aegis TaxID=1735272 RepID=UPI001B88D045|nr:microprocessor complex subunit DGCR8-like [Gigantopelta aegis]XP_041348915.1 microprocessor complex subunit DGCR8-like [Gigantopelta aegis]